MQKHHTARVFITPISTVIIMVTDKGSWDAFSISTLKLRTGTSMCWKRI